MMKFNHFRYSKQWIAVLLSIFFMSSVIAQVDITCPAETDLGTYDCTTIQNVPATVNSIAAAEAAPYNLVINNPSESTSVTTEDSDIIFYCTGDVRSATRTIRVYEDMDFSFSYTEGDISATCTYTIGTVADVMSPVFTAPPLIDLSCDVDIDDLSITGMVVSITDENCPVSSSSEFTNYSDAFVQNSPCPGSSVVTRSWTAVDPCGNGAEPQTQKINLIDSDGPTFTVPADVTLECGADITDLSLSGDVTDEGDNCDGVTSIEANYRDVDTMIETVGCDEITTITRTWFARDGCNNVTTIDQIITIRCEAAVPVCNTDPCLGDLEQLGADGCSCDVVETQVLGCNDPAAQNYDPAANCNIDFCNFTLAGCVDKCAPNYNPDATEDDGSCEIYSTTDCNTDCTIGNVEIWDATTCSCAVDVVSIQGCMDATSCNYNASANCDNGSCVPFPVCNDDPCLGDITTLAGSDPCSCSIVTPQVLGCDDETAQNYNPDANCNDGSCIYGPNCSYTQGFWGNKGGKQNGFTTTELIDAAIESAGGSITIGTDGQSLTVSSAKCVLALLPSSSGSRALKAGDEVYEGNCTQNKKNRIKNRLAGETLVLSLNTLTSPGLNTVVLCDPANCLVDRVPDTVCEALGEGGTIADLLVLANETLGGVYDVTDRNFYSDVNEAINVISERYDECRNPCEGGGERLAALSATIKSLNVEPNPVTNMLTIEFDSNIAKESAKLEIYQLNGQKVFEQTIITEIGLQSNKVNLSSIPQGIYMVTLNIGGEVITKKIIKENK